MKCCVHNKFIASSFRYRPAPNTDSTYPPVEFPYARTTILYLPG